MVQGSPPQVQVRSLPKRLAHAYAQGGAVYHSHIAGSAKPTPKVSPLLRLGFGPGCS